MPLEKLDAPVFRYVWLALAISCCHCTTPPSARRRYPQASYVSGLMYKYAHAVHAVSRAAYTQVWATLVAELLDFPAFPDEIARFVNVQQKAHALTAPVVLRRRYEL